MDFANEVHQDLNLENRLRREDPDHMNRKPPLSATPPIGLPPDWTPPPSPRMAGGSSTTPRGSTPRGYFLSPRNLPSSPRSCASGMPNLSIPRSSAADLT